MKRSSDVCGSSDVEVIDLAASPEPEPTSPLDRIASTGKPRYTIADDGIQKDAQSSVDQSGVQQPSSAERVNRIRWRPYYMLSTPQLPAACNHMSLTIDDLFSGDIKGVLMMNYMYDISWLLQACPLLLDPAVPVCCLHGEKGEAQKNMTRLLIELQLSNWTCSGVDMGAETYGTHHSKLIILFYLHGMRLVVSTANMIESDFIHRTQGVYVQDFPLKSSSVGASVCSKFEADLFSYLNHIEVASVDTRSAFRNLLTRMRGYDFSAAEVIIVASVPGRHSAKNHEWGHLKLAEALRSNGCHKVEMNTNTKVVMQFSSVGSMGKNESYLLELHRSMTGAAATDYPIQLVWPTVDCVRHSLQGYSAGGSLPCSAKTMFSASGTFEIAEPVGRPSLKRGFADCLHRWEGSPLARHAATPHMKCYFRYSQREKGIDIHWFLLTSMNLSQAAWGVLQSGQSKLYIKSYEIGILFIPSLVKTRHRVFSCTPNHSILGIDRVSDDTLKTKRPRFDECQDADKSSKTIEEEVASKCFLGYEDISIPFQVPPPKYDLRLDEPWTWDSLHLAPDNHGRVWNP